jgi:ribosomal protein L11 methylase PrmA
MSSLPVRNLGSFRDPSAYIFQQGNRILRAVTPVADAAFADVMSSGIVDKLADKGLMIGCKRVLNGAADLSQYRGARGEPIAALYEHPRIPFVSYPYEWSFSQLKDAALAHLDLQIEALGNDFVLSDASAYNMQFYNGRPIHIDVTSLRRYRNGQVWEGYNQFCRQFLLPLVIEAWAGMPFQSIYRGSINGITFGDALSILPRRKLFTSMGGFMHVYMQGRTVTTKSATTTGGRVEAPSLPKTQYLSILQHLRGFVASLQSAKRSRSYWTDYAATNTYSDGMRRVKLDFVSKWAQSARPGSIIDIGGNTGDFSLAALESGGASFAVVLDGDIDAIERGYRSRRSPALLHLLMNVADPSPDLGWRQAERQGLSARADTGGVIALAVVHHMVIGANLPLLEVVDWLLDIAPTGILEFVPKGDPMVDEMLQLREDIFPDYTEETFRALVTRRARITAEHKFAENGRLLIAFERA